MKGYRKPTPFELSAAYDDIRRYARAVCEDMDLSAGGDTYVYNGGTNNVDDLNAALETLDALRIVGVPTP